MSVARKAWPSQKTFLPMFDPDPDNARVFGLPCGADFAAALVDGIKARLADQPPEAMARVTLIVNTTRMQRRITEVFDAGGATFLPRIRLLSTLEAPNAPAAEDVISPLARRLELVELVRELIARDQTLAPASAAFDLADSLAALMDELRDEHLDPSVIDGLDVSDQSGHWQRAKAFLMIVTRFFEANAELDAMTRQAQLVDLLTDHWQAHPAQDPILLAGSTASRGTARRLMQAVARLPQGAVILPGLDMAMPPHVWQSLRDISGLQEDHPQYRLMAFCDAVERDPATLPAWHDTPAPAPARNALVSLALRPAPVTHAWRDEGPDLDDLEGATRGLTLLTSQSQREEALSIALRLREAAETEQSAALITPDRTLTRLVTVMLDQWGITPDDSAGIPLHFTPPGRFLRHVAELQSDRITAEGLLVLLKHPLCHTGAARNTHLRHTRDLELRVRRKGPPFPTADDLTAFGTDHDAESWAAWLNGCLAHLPDPDHPLPISERFAAHLAVAEALAAGSESTGSGTLWQQLAGSAARDLMDRLDKAAPSGGVVTAREYLSLFSAILSGEQQTDRDAGHPHIRIWGTLEARVMGADLLILGGLNEGVWPEAPAPDPWLNRALRKQAGMLLPERRIGLSAHDFQQAIGAPEVWLTRSIRSDGAETVPSRWLNRLTNLLGGLEAGAPALEKMQERGNAWIDLARRFEAVTESPAAPRPSPRPPVAARPTRLSVTQIRTLTRDPYAIYARHVLGLRPIDPLVKTADAAMRGTVMHLVFERFLRAGDLSHEALLRNTASTLTEQVPWPEIRTLWKARLARIADHFLNEEAARQEAGNPIEFECPGRMELPKRGFTLSAKADRIDRRQDGSLALYDYKTGAPPTRDQQKIFDKQLLLMRAMAEAGSFDNVPAAPVSEAAYIGVGLSPKTVPAPLVEEPKAKTLEELDTLISAMQGEGFGFTARRAMTSDSFAGDYDLLARFGEWDTTDEAVPEDLS